MTDLDVLDEKARRKLHKQEVKAAKRATRELSDDAVAVHRKACAACGEPRDVLVRCKTTSEGPWQMLCTRGCWQRVSGGVIDGDSEGYTYGGMWSNPYSLKNAHRPKHLPHGVKHWVEGSHFARNDKAYFEGVAYECRHTHDSVLSPPEDEHNWKLTVTP